MSIKRAMSPIDLGRLDATIPIKEEPSPIDLSRPGFTASTKKEESPTDLGPMPVKKESSPNDFSHPSPTVPTEQEPMLIDHEHQDRAAPAQKELSPVIQRNPEATGGLYRGYAYNNPRPPRPAFFQMAFRLFARDYFNAVPHLSFEVFDVFALWAEKRNLYISHVWNSMHSRSAPPPGACWFLLQSPFCGCRVLRMDWHTFHNPPAFELLQEAQIISNILFMELDMHLIETFPHMGIMKRLSYGGK